jgi:hypothetical protein
VHYCQDPDIQIGINIVQAEKVQQGMDPSEVVSDGPKREEGYKPGFCNKSERK